MTRGILLSLLMMSMPLCAQTVSYQYAGGTYQGYVVTPMADAPLVLLLHDWDGLTEYEMQRADMLAEMGYAVFAADLFGADVRPTSVEDKRLHTGELYQDREKMRGLMNAALEKAASIGLATDNAVAMGYCFGGAAVLEMARSGADMKGFVSFHGGLATPVGQDYSQVNGKILILHGAADHHISLEEFAQLGNDLEQQGTDYELIAYGGARHAFTVFGGDRFHPEAEKRSWQRFGDFLEETLQ